MGPWGQIAVALALAAAGQVRETRRRGAATSRPSGLSRWLSEPRNGVFLVLATALSVGGGRKLLQWWRARAAVARLGEPDLSAAEVEAASAHGRAALMELFRLLGTADAGPIRDAAGRALAALWAQDNLIVEEEKALVLRGFSAAWRARRRYPRDMRAPIPISVDYGVPFLRESGEGVRPENLEWSHRILGTRRAGPESFSEWKAGPGRAEFAVYPDDFDANGPHRLIVHARARTVGLSGSWELELPQVPFHLEFDPQLLPEALFALADAARGERVAGAVRLEPSTSNETDSAQYLSLNESFALRNPPSLVVTTPLPCDLAHAQTIELEGVAGTASAGSVVLSGQGSAIDEPSSTRSFPLQWLDPLGADALERPGVHRIRAVLTADPDRGWGDPDVRSIWPGTIVTDWVEVAVVRR